MIRPADDQPRRTRARQRPPTHRPSERSPPVAGAERRRLRHRSAPEPAVRKVESAPVEPIDLLETAGAHDAEAAGAADRWCHRPARGVAPGPPASLNPVAPAGSASCSVGTPRGLRGGRAGRAGRPVVIRNAPLLDDGTPMPTRYWLVGATRAAAVGRLEAAGGVRRARRRSAPASRPPTPATPRARRRPAAGPRVRDRPGGVGGTARGVKCLHAHYAWYLAGGDDPVGPLGRGAVGGARDGRRPPSTSAPTPPDLLVADDGPGAAAVPDHPASARACGSGAAVDTRPWPGRWRSSRTTGSCSTSTGDAGPGGRTPPRAGGRQRDESSTALEAVLGVRPRCSRRTRRAG